MIYSFSTDFGLLLSVTIGTIQRRLAWPLRKDDTQNREALPFFASPADFLPASAVHEQRLQSVTHRTVKSARRLFFLFSSPSRIKKTRTKDKIKRLVSTNRYHGLGKENPREEWLEEWQGACILSSSQIPPSHTAYTTSSSPLPPLSLFFFGFPFHVPYKKLHKIRRRA